MKFATALRLGRVSNVPTVWTNVFAGVGLAGAGLGAGATATICIAVSLLYIGGMFLNDAFDAEVDAVERPERPIPAGLVTRREVLAYAAVMFALGVVLAFTTGTLAGVGAITATALIVLYDWVHKRTWLAPGLMAACRVAVYWTAGLAVVTPRFEMIAWGGAVLFAYVLGLTYAAARENTHAVVRIVPLLGLIAPGLATAPYLVDRTSGLLALILFVGWTAWCVRLVRSRQPTSIRRGIGGLIAGIALVDGLWLASVYPSSPAFASAIGAFALTILLQRYVAGT